MKCRRILSVLSALTLMAGSMTGISVSAAEKGAGDVDQNGKVEIADAIMLARWLAEDDITVTTAGLADADLNGDGIVTSEDQGKLLCRLAGIPEEQPAERRSVDLLKGIETSEGIKGKAADAAFVAAQSKFSVDLLKQALEKETDKNKNLLVSPLSVSLALGMTMNGAKGDTLAEMQKVLGGELTADELNAYYKGWSDRLLAPETVRYYGYNEDGYFDEIETESAPVTLANAIWIKDDEQMIRVPRPFLQNIADYYRAGVFKAPCDDTTVDDVNIWCDENTHHMIPKVLDELSPDAVMLLANALTFEDVWDTQYEDYRVGDGTFTAANGEIRDVKMMHSEEGVYLSDDEATGFMKDYRDRRYSFAALLPNEDISIDDYIASLDGEKLEKLLQTKDYCDVNAAMPKFSFDYSTELGDVLKALGMPTAFGEGETAPEFTGLNEANVEGDTKISRVIHKTHIDVSESGTKAAAVTVVEMCVESAVEEPPQPKIVKLDRPFVFMILDNQTGLPLFIGAVKDIL
ncbi:MAG: hypothetical protein J6Z45_00710 [Oscillospiraceae bacterium]|nr:hypothetical protein [Oscillospiraceae bacterium]